MVKKSIVIVMLMFLLAGCSQPDYETLGEVEHDRSLPQPKSVSLRLPGEASVSALSDGEGEKLYFLDGYVVAVQTMEAGDLNRTLQTVTGFPQESLRLISYSRDGITCYDGAWATAGEGGDHVGRLTVLDDGDYHYVVSAMAPEQVSGSLGEVWQVIFASISLVEE